jgi:outer membrane protein assembly factor BamB
MKITTSIVLWSCLVPALFAQDIQQLRDSSGFRGGLIVHLGCGDGRQTALLGTGGNCLVQGLDTSASAVKSAREHLAAQGIHGSVTAAEFDGKTLPYIDNVVNLLVIDDAFSVAREEMMRVLCPGGELCTKQDGKWKTVTKPRPEDIDEWSHFLHGADNNAVAKDLRITTPRHLQWDAEPKRTRDHDALASISAMTSSGGRIFYIVDEGPTSLVHHPASWKLIARDAFNGKTLWRRDVPLWVTHLHYFRSGPVQLPRMLVSVGDRVYVTLGLGAPVTMLDAANGETLLTYEGSEDAEEIICHDGVMLTAIGDPKLWNRYADKPDNYWDFYVENDPGVPQKTIAAYRADTGELLWKKSGESMRRYVPLSLTAGDNRVFYMDHERLYCVDLETGEDLWQSPFATKGLFLVSYCPTVVHYKDKILCLSVDRLAVFSAEDGSLCWENKGYAGFGSSGDLFVIDDVVWTFPGIQAIKVSPQNVPGGGSEFLAFDLHTGEVKKSLVKKEVWPGGHHHRCYRNKATERFLISGRRGVEFVDLDGDENTINWWIRGCCQYGIMPCNGLVYVPPHPCQCFNLIKFDGFHALSGKSSLSQLEPQDTDRLTRGPAYGQIRNLPSEIRNQADWPTYRCDASRSGCAKVPVPAEIEKSWQAAIGGKLSSVVVADDRLLVCSLDEQTVYCLDAQGGEILWRYPCEGRVDSPPTIYAGMAIFGSGDGHVYALRLTDGQLVWRFRGAPVDRRTVVRERIESVWPIDGSVLVLRGVVYFAAGHSSYLDGGIRLCGLDARTGKLLHSATVSSEGASNKGALPDILVSDGTSIGMRQVRFDASLSETGSRSPMLMATTGLLEDGFAHRWNWTLGGGGAPFGKLLVFDDDMAYGVQSFYTFLKHDSSMHPPTHTGHLHQKYARYQKEWFPIGNRIYAQSRKRNAASDSSETRADKKRKKAGKFGIARHAWTVTAAVQIRAMVLADDTLFAAGWKDSVTIFENGGGPEKEAILMVVSTDDGKLRAQYPLEACPTFDGMAAAYGRLYLSLKNGTVECWGGVR